MADASDPSATGEEAFGYFFAHDAERVVELLARLRLEARTRGMNTVAEGALTLLEIVISDLTRLAAQMAGTADATIITKIIETRSRNRPSMTQMPLHIRSEPGPLGSVRVALISELDKIINPAGYGPYWRAQEYGTGSDEVPSQVGRPLYGTFEPSGEPPEAAQRGLGVGADAAFIPGGANPGAGTISEELPGRHFLRDGSSEAGARYIAAVAELRRKWDAQIAELLKQAQSASRGGMTRGIVTDH